MERKRNPERAVTKGLSGRLSQGMNGREDKGTVQKKKGLSLPNRRI